MCLFNHAWPGTAQTALNDDTRKMLYGSLFSLKQFILKMRPVGGDGNTSSGYYAFRTNNYKLHVHETPTGLLFLLATEPGAGQLKETMRKLVTNWVDVTAKNPAAEAPDALPSEMACVDLTKSVQSAIDAAKLGETS